MFNGPESKSNKSADIMPIEEILQEEEFTGRVKELKDCEDWIKNAGQNRAGSIAMIAPRRIGKTVLLDRLVNTVFFKPEYKAAPFYIKIRREETTLRRFLLEYATVFFRQFIAYCLQDPVLYRKKTMKLSQLLSIASEQRGVITAKQYIEEFLKRYQESDWEDARNHWDNFITVPEDLASFSGINTAVIIDEFQDMKSFIYDVNDELFIKLKGENAKKPGYGATDLTATYSHQALSKKAPMLVSGSAVTLIFRTVMGGPLGGRFGFKYLKPFSHEDGATLMINLLKIYNPEKSIRIENALYASVEVSGHPYYLYCIATSDYDNKAFDSKKNIDEIISYEIKNGKIYGFWRTHFEENRENINYDNDQEIGKKILYYLTKYNDQTIDSREIAKKIGATPKVVDDKLEKLYEADIIYRAEFKNVAFNDICLMRFIQQRYQNELADIEEIDLQEKGKFNHWKGKFLELIVAHTMNKFDDDILPGSYFGQSNTITAPRMMIVDSKHIKAHQTGEYQIDAYAREFTQKRVWLVECKYSQKAASIDIIKKLEEAKKAVEQNSKVEEADIPAVIFWVVSTGGFTREALHYAENRSDIYLSDYDGINNIFRHYGGGYNIPIF